MVVLVWFIGSKRRKDGEGRTKAERGSKLGKEG
jgi:hypothetical protein